MLKETRIGWIFALSFNENSAWGNVEEFYDNILDCEEKDKILEISSDVWGKTQRKDMVPSPGDGFAFYHTSRAQYPIGDKYKGLPRISLVGRLDEIDVKGQDVSRIMVKTYKKLVKAFIKNPIIRDESTKHIFLRCGIVPGPIASFYFADTKAWAEIMQLVDVRVPLDKLEGV